MNYLRIAHGDGWLNSKKVYDFVLPGIFTALTCIAFRWLDMHLAIFENTELTKRILDLLALMIVFYMAALAAVATFDRKGIDDPLRGGDATLKIRNHNGGETINKPLSYRQFISYLFGYLSFLSLCLYVWIVILAVVWPELEKHYKPHVRATFDLDYIANPIFFLLVVFALWQLIFTSLLGIYFLTERIQSLNETSH